VEKHVNYLVYSFKSPESMGHDITTEETDHTNSPSIKTTAAFNTKRIKKKMSR